MSDSNKVVWFEGLFLQPQHLQQQDRYVENLIMNRPNVLGLHNWGFTELKLDQNLLTLGKIALLSCRGIFPDGTAFNVPAEGYAPLPIEIPSGTINSIVYLALPLRRPGLAEIRDAKDDSKLFRYSCKESEVGDINANSDTVTNVQVAQLALRIILEQEGLNGYTYLPIAKIIEISANKQIALEESFLPSCLDIKAISPLVNFVNELLGLLHNRGETLVNQYLEIMDCLLLQIINRAEMLIKFFTSGCSIHPEFLYINLIQLLGELATYTNKTRRPIELPHYNHYDLQSTFTPIIKEFRKVLSAVTTHNIIPLNLELREHGVWVWSITDKDLLYNSSFILAVKASMPQETLKAQFMSQVKIAPVENINSLVSRALLGVDLHPLAVIPKYVPFYTDFVYFSLNQEHPYWKELSNSAGIAMHIGNQFPNLELQFWALRSEVQQDNTSLGGFYGARS